MFKKNQQFATKLSGPLLDKLQFAPSSTINFDQYPFSLNIIKNLSELSFPTQVTFFVGENGTGKSTILQAIAHHAGFGTEGGSKNFSFSTARTGTYTGSEQFAQHLKLSWRLKPKDGYFFKAESFYNIANYIDYLEGECGGNAYGSYGGKSLHEQSHGESFLSFFSNRMGKGGFFVLDEPEAALSPQRQLALLVLIKQLCHNSATQFIIASHSPILLAYPEATIYSCDNEQIHKTSYEQTAHYQVTKDFLNDPQLYLQHLFAD